MNDKGKEKIISLEDIDYTHFWGSNDKMLDFVRLLFPSLSRLAPPTSNASCKP